VGDRLPRDAPRARPGMREPCRAGVAHGVGCWHDPGAGEPIGGPPRACGTSLWCRRRARTMRSVRRCRGRWQVAWRARRRQGGTAKFSTREATTPPCREPRRCGAHAADPRRTGVGCAGKALQNDTKCASIHSPIVRWTYVDPRGSGAARADLWGKRTRARPQDTLAQ